VGYGSAEARPSAAAALSKPIPSPGTRPPPPPPKMGPFEQRWLSNNSNLLSVSGA